MSTRSTVSGILIAVLLSWLWPLSYWVPTSFVPAASAAPAGVPNLLSLNRIGYQDVQGFGRGLLVFSVLAPETWKTQGGLLWTNNANCLLLPVSLYFRAENPSGTAAIDFLPSTLRAWSDSPQMQQLLYQQHGTAQHDFCLTPGPPMDARTYFQQVLVPTYRSGIPDFRVTGQRSLPEVAEAARQRTTMFVDPNQIARMRQTGAGDMRFGADAVVFETEYTHGGTLFKEVFLVTLVTTQTLTNTGVGYLSEFSNLAEQLIAMRAPAEVFDRYAPIFDAILLSVEFNLQWAMRLIEAVNAIVQQQSAALMAIHRDNVRTRQAITKAVQDVSRFRSESMARMHEGFVRRMKGIERWADPNTGEIWEVPYGHSRVWRGHGQEMLVENPDRPLLPHQEPPEIDATELRRLHQ